jgi:hypothetical protein
MCFKTAKFAEFVEQTKKKYPQYPLIYIFGKDKGKSREDDHR